MSMSVGSLLDNSDPRNGGKAITNQGLVDGGGGGINPGGADKKAAAQSRAPKAHFTQNDCARLIYARTILDHHYDQRINSAQTKMQFVVEKYNDGFEVLAKFVDGAANDIHFDPWFVHMSQRNGWVKHFLQKIKIWTVVESAFV